jgi:chromosomal replication initiator protein
MKEANHIIDIVANYYNVDKNDIVNSRNREDKIVIPRHVSQYLIREMTELSLKDIGLIYDRKYPTIIHSIQKVQVQMDSKYDNRMRNDVIKLRKLIKIN